MKPAAAFESLEEILCRVGLTVRLGDNQRDIPGSHWGPPEAGLINNTLYVRDDTPLHSALHEAAHYICMTPARRQVLDTDAGGSDLEESAVCYLQICLTDLLPGVSRERLMRDMDSWGYSFRLGSTQAWFEKDSADAREALIQWGIIDRGEQFLFNRRR